MGQMGRYRYTDKRLYNAQEGVGVQSNLHRPRRTAWSPLISGRSTEKERATSLLYRRGCSMAAGPDSHRSAEPVRSEMESGLVPIPRVLAGVALLALLGQAPLLRRLCVRHVLAMLAQDAAPIYGAPEAPERTIYVFPITNFNSYRQGRFLRLLLVFRMRVLVLPVTKNKRSRVKVSWKVLGVLAGRCVLSASGRQGTRVGMNEDMRVESESL